ncbi:MAG: penicillin-insensitive murein endopeptidase [Myxococcota bacterium]
MRKRYGHGTVASAEPSPAIRGALWLVTVAATVALSGCIGLVPDLGHPQSVGQTSNGILRHGVSLPDSGEGFIRARPGEATRFGTPTMVGALTRAAASVARRYPGGAPLRVGDIAYPAGGQHPRHGSHRTGRDVDVIFYVRDITGRSVRGRGWLGFGRHGTVRETVTPGDGPPSNDLFFFDDARNWHFVRSLLADQEAAVQWIFCARGVKARLLEYARVHEPDPEIVFRASWVLHQPGRGHPHHDHFHVRVACTEEEQWSQCQNTGPVWPWIRRAVEKRQFSPGMQLDDETLLRALLDDSSDEAELASAE